LDSWLRRHPLAPDSVLALVIWACLAFPYLLTDSPTKFVIATLMTAPLVVRRRYPQLSFAVISIACALSLAAGSSVPMVSVLAYPSSLYAVSVYGVAWARYAGLGVGLFGSALGGYWFSRPDVTFTSWLFLTMLFAGGAGLSWGIGAVVRVRRIFTERLQAQNEALSRDQEQRAELAATAERARIAREMHDVVAHGLSVIVVQADGAAYAAAHSAHWTPEQAVRTLATIADTAREALQETRALVGMLRRGESAQYGPTAGLAGLSDLLDGVRDSGYQVELDLAPLGPLPAEIDLACLRIIQESLTNVIKHAGPDVRITVQLSRFHDSKGGGVLVRVSDDGKGGPVATGGSGLIGMRERAEAVGGRLSFGPNGSRGFVVHAEFPSPAQQPSPPSPQPFAARPTGAT
jgi:signal transduction histidine kinase